MIELVNETIDRTLSGERADRALRDVLRAHPTLSSDERGQVARWSLGLCVWRGRVDALSRNKRSLWLPVFLADRQVMSTSDAAALCGVDASTLDALLSDPPAHENPIEALAFRRSLPAWLAARWNEVFGADRADRLAAAMNEPGPISIRANTLLIDAQSLARRLREEGVESEPGRLMPDALRLMGRPNINGLSSWRQSLFEVQDEGSQFIVQAVDAKPGERIVDLCAGAGGKTLALAAQTTDRGELVAVEPDLRRVADLRGRLRRAGVSSVEVRAGDATEDSLLADWEGRADAVLVDAPCSETGTLRRGPDARWRIDPQSPERWAELQRRLLARAARLVRPGGRLVYATCSLDPVENEEVAHAVDLSGFKPVSHRTLAPDTDGTDGFFVCVWRRDV